MALEPWPTVPIGEVCDGIFDGPHATPAKIDSGAVFLGIWNIENGRIDLSTTEHISDVDWPRWTRRVAPTEGDLVFSYETKLGAGALIPAGLRCCLGRRMALARPNRRKVDPRFLLYTFLAPDFQECIRNYTISGSTVDRIPLLEFPKFPIKLPPLPEQRAIARVLGGLDDKIELNRRMNRTLEDLARGLFRSWFVDFDPVTKNGCAKAAGAPNGLFPKRLVDSPLGPIPEGWRVCSLREAFEVNPTRRIPAGEVAPYLDMQNMPTDSAVPDEWIMRACGSGMKFQNGDTLMARITPCLENGKTAYVNFLADGQIGWGSTEYIVLRSRPPLPPEQSYFLARDEDFRSFAIANMTGSSGRQRVPATAFDKYLVVVPDAKAATAFGVFARGVLERVRMNSEESRRLAATRDALLPQLLSGEIRLNSDAAVVEEALA